MFVSALHIWILVFPILLGKTAQKLLLQIQLWVDHLGCLLWTTPVAKSLRLSYWKVKLQSQFSSSLQTEAGSSSSSITWCYHQHASLLKWCSQIVGVPSKHRSSRLILLSSEKRVFFAHLLGLQRVFWKTPNTNLKAVPFFHTAQLCGVSWLCLSSEQLLPTDLWISQASSLGLLFASLTDALLIQAIVVQFSFHCLITDCLVLNQMFRIFFNHTLTDTFLEQVSDLFWQVLALRDAVYINMFSNKLWSL